jgi:hypothetical protein
MYDPGTAWEFSIYRRQFNQSLASAAALLVLAAHQQVRALSLSDLTDKDASQGLKVALEKGALAAVSLLGKPDGFLGNPKVRIPLPGFLENAAKLLKMTGQGKRVDELVTSMNRAAEAAIPMGKDLLVGAVKNMSVADAKNIFSGGDNSVTRFFCRKNPPAAGREFFAGGDPGDRQGGLGRQVQPGGGQDRQPGLAQARRRQHPAVRDGQVARRPPHHHWRGRTQDSPRPGGYWERYFEEGLWCAEMSASHGGNRGGYFNLARASVSLASRYSP